MEDTKKGYILKYVTRDSRGDRVENFAPLASYLEKTNIPGGGRRVELIIGRGEGRPPIRQVFEFPRDGEEYYLMTHLGDTFDSWRANRPVGAKEGAKR